MLANCSALSEICNIKTYVNVFKPHSAIGPDGYPYNSKYPPQYDKYGYFLDSLDSFTLKGKDGAEKIQSLMVYFRNEGKNLFEGIREVQDYSVGIRDLPKENVLKYIWTDGSWLAVRPSGTEPKIKVYYSISEKSKEKATERFEKIRDKIHSIIK